MASDLVGLLDFEGSLLGSAAGLARLWRLLFLGALHLLDLSTVFRINYDDTHPDPIKISLTPPQTTRTKATPTPSRCYERPNANPKMKSGIGFGLRCPHGVLGRDTIGTS